jgi:hypothetical protein
LFFPADKWHISGISVLGKKLKIPARNGYEGHEGDESVKNEKDVSYIFLPHISSHMTPW